MKKLIVSNWISLDGYIAGPGGALDWSSATGVSHNTKPS
jgi:hypothetical protein